MNFEKKTKRKITSTTVNGGNPTYLKNQFEFHHLLTFKLNSSTSPSYVYGDRAQLCN